MLLLGFSLGPLVIRVYPRPSCYEKFNLGDRVSGTQCIEAQESLAAKRGGGGVGIGFTTKTLDIGVTLSYNIPMLTVLATCD